MELNRVLASSCNLLLPALHISFRLRQVKCSWRVNLHVHSQTQNTMHKVTVSFNLRSNEYNMNSPTLHLVFLIRYFTTCLWPSWHATWRAVLPSFPRVLLTSAPFCTRAFTICRLPFQQALYKGRDFTNQLLPPLLIHSSFKYSSWFGFAPCSSRDTTFSGSSASTASHSSLASFSL